MPLDIIFSPLLVFLPAISILIFAIIVLILINLCYKFLMNQKEVNELKKQTKDLNKKMKEAQKERDMNKSKEIMKEMMGLNSRLMRQTMKPMLASLIIVFILLPWMNGTYAEGVPLPASNSSMSANVTLIAESFSLEKTGNVVSIYSAGSLVNSCTIENNRILSNGTQCQQQTKSGIWRVNYVPKGCQFIICSEESISFDNVVAFLPVPLPIVGGDVGWLGWYFIVSIPLMLIIRKLMGINV